MQQLKMIYLLSIVVKMSRCGVCIADVLNGDTAITQAEEYIHLNQEFSSSILTCSKRAYYQISL